MSNQGSKLPLLAAGLAAAAVGLCVVVVVLLTRGGGEPTVPAEGNASAMPIEDGRASAAEVVAALTADVEPSGLGFDAGAVAAWRALGLREGDVLRSVQGLTDRNDWRRTRLLNSPSLLYVEIERGGRAMLLRRSIAGDLSQQQRAAMSGAGMPGLGFGGPNPPSLAGIDPTAPFDPLAAPRNPPALGPSIDLALAAAIAKIRKLDDTHFEIPADVIDEVQANPMGFSRGARVVASVKNGQLNGFKVYAIKPSSLFAALGLENGDTIETVNGAALGGMDDALALYGKLALAKRFDVTGVRRGKPLALRYDIK